MCGICGFTQQHDYSYDRSKIVRAMNNMMSHRGPDDEGYYSDGSINLGHKRLSIIDLQFGHQPIFNEDKNKVIIYNGEIYNYAELKSELQKLGHVFTTNSDTETILHAYEEYGVEFLEKLNGMFAFAIWDSKERKLLIARDRLGIKQVYWYYKDGIFIFASEIKPILKHPSFEKKFNLKALDNYFTFRFVQAPLTPFENLYKLEPGSFLILDKNFNINIKKYWNIKFNENKSNYSLEEHIEEFRFKFEDSVKHRLMSEVPVGIFLSGGLDSSAVVAALSRNGHKNLKTFSIGFKDHKEYNESYYADLVAKKFNTDHHQINIDFNDFITGIEKYIFHSEELMSDPASIPLYYVAQLASKHVKVILSGEGGDEILAGYSYWMAYKSYNRHLKFRKIPQIIRSYMFSPLNTHFFKSSRLEKYLKASEKPLYMHNIYFNNDISYGPRFSKEDKEKILSKDTIDALDIKREIDYLKESYLNLDEYNVIDQELYVDQKYWLPDNLLLKADKMTMAHSLELRVPFLDHTFVEYVNNLPINLRLNKEKNNTYNTKYILRKSYENILPAEIVTRPKKGFPVPVENILKTDLKHRFLDNLNDSKINQSKLLDTSYISKIFNDYCQSDNDLTKIETRLWSIFIFFEWLKIFL